MSVDQPVQKKKVDKESWDYRYSFWIHTFLTDAGKYSPQTPVHSFLTFFWTTISILNNGFLWILGLIFLVILELFWGISVFPEDGFPPGAPFRHYTPDGGTEIPLYRQSHAIYIFSALFLLDVIVCGVLKKIFKRERPPYFEKSALGRATGFGRIIHRSIDGYGPDVFSFPSGHCSRMTMYAMYAFTYLPYGGWLRLIVGSGVCLCAVLMSLSRVAIAKHYVADVLVGCLVGTVQAVPFIVGIRIVEVLVFS